MINKSNKKLKKQSGKPNNMKYKRKEKKLEKNTKEKRRNGTPMTMLISKLKKFNL
jgi:hypothetical protein